MRTIHPRSSSTRPQTAQSPAPTPAPAPTPTRWVNIVLTSTARRNPPSPASLPANLAQSPAPAADRRTIGVRSMNLMREDAFRIDWPRGSSVCRPVPFPISYFPFRPPPFSLHIWTFSDTNRRESQRPKRVPRQGSREPAACRLLLFHSRARRFGR